VRSSLLGQHLHVSGWVAGKSEGFDIVAAVYSLPSNNRGTWDVDWSIGSIATVSILEDLPLNGVLLFTFSRGLSRVNLLISVHSVSEKGACFVVTQPTAHLQDTLYNQYSPICLRTEKSGVDLRSSALSSRGNEREILD